jgi:hypothetical protein
VSALPVDTRANASTPPVQGTFNAVLVATMHNTIYLYDADNENRLPDGKTKPLWATWLGQPRPGDKDAIDMWSTNDPEWGVLGTPVIDPQKTTVWVVAWRADGNAYHYELHALDLRSGAHRRQPVVIGGAPLDAHDPCTYKGGFNACKQKQRAGLLLDHGTLYLAFGGDGSSGTLFAFDAATLAQKGLWTTTPKGRNGGIWQSGQGPAADAAGDVYLVTGNGTFDADRKGPNYGDSLVRLHLGADGSLAVADYFTPCNQQFLDSIDLDFGSGGAMLVPNSTLVLGGGKEGIIYLLQRGALGKYAAPAAGPTGCKNPNALQSFQATELHVHGAGTTYGHIHSSPVFWRGPDHARLYVWGENDRLKAYSFAGGKFTGLDTPKKSIYQPPNGMPGGMLSVSSNAQKAGTGILWAAVPLDGDANQFRGVQGILLALDAQDVSKQLWTSELGGARDRLGLFAKYAPPTIAGGKVFVATYGDREVQRSYGGNARPTQFPARYSVVVYGLLPAHGAHGKPIVNQDADDVTVTQATATTALALDTRTCDAAAPGNVECTAALARKVGAPPLHAVVVPAGYDFAGCRLLTVTTASKQAALNDASGIGWYAADAAAGSQSMTNGRFVPKAELKPAGTATFRSGAPAVLNQFSAMAGCTVGGGSYDKLFKPFMQFDNAPDGNVYRNWDRAQDYRVSRAFPQFDRSADVLAR